MRVIIHFKTTQKRKSIVHLVRVKVVFENLEIKKIIVKFEQKYNDILKFLRVIIFLKIIFTNVRILIFVRVIIYFKTTLKEGIKFKSDFFLHNNIIKMWECEEYGGVNR